MHRQRHASRASGLMRMHQVGTNGHTYLAVKRSCDFLIAGTLLLGLSPLFALVALLIKFDSRGRVFFEQERMGAIWTVDATGRVRWTAAPFKILKFRSMEQNADQSIHERHIRAFVTGALEADSGAGTFKLEHDRRITRVGKLLRRLSIDELPQLINVIRGEMSLVGPRPVPIYEVEGYQTRHFERLHALPGITGYWQVYGRSQVSFEEMVKMDINYVRTASLWLDFKIVCQTLPAVLSGKGAA